MSVCDLEVTSAITIVLEWSIVWLLSFIFRMKTSPVRLSHTRPRDSSSLYVLLQKLFVRNMERNLFLSCFRSLLSNLVLFSLRITKKVKYDRLITRSRSVAVQQDSVILSFFHGTDVYLSFVVRPAVAHQKLPAADVLRCWWPNTYMSSDARENRIHPQRETDSEWPIWPRFLLSVTKTKTKTFLTRNKINIKLHKI